MRLIRIANGKTDGYPFTVEPKGNDVVESSDESISTEFELKKRELLRLFNDTLIDYRDATGSNKEAHKYTLQKCMEALKLGFNVDVRKYDGARGELVQQLV